MTVPSLLNLSKTLHDIDTKHFDKCNKIWIIIKSWGIVWFGFWVNIHEPQEIRKPNNRERERERRKWRERGVHVSPTTLEHLGF